VVDELVANLHDRDRFPTSDHESSRLAREVVEVTQAARRMGMTDAEIIVMVRGSLARILPRHSGVHFQEPFDVMARRAVDAALKLTR
jgi:hypothetical protein